MSLLGDNTYLNDEYEVRKVIGRGSCGVVYLGYSLEDETEVAIKEFPYGGEVLQSFYRELSIVFSLKHTNLISCLNLIQRSSPPHYLIYEYADQGSLRDVIVDGKSLSTEKISEVIRQVCLGLAYAHGQGIIHRDIKPENILVCSSAEGLIYKLTDLGLSTTIQEKDPEQSNGSPLYMAPEQFYDRSSYASDFYSLGVLLFEMISGKWPFEGTPEELFTLHCQKDPDWSLLGDSPLIDVTKKLLKKKAGERPESAEKIIALVDASASSDPSVEVTLKDRPISTTEEEPSPRISNESLKSLSYYSLEAPFEVEVPGGRKLFYLANSEPDKLWLSDFVGLDSFDIERMKLTRQVLSSPCLSIDGNTNYTYYVGDKFLHRSVMGKKAIQKMFAVPHGSISYSKGGQEHFFATNRHLFKLDVSGLFGWKKLLSNYYLPPCLVGLSDGSVFAGSGPNSPELRKFDRDGNESLSFKLPGPLLTLNYFKPTNCISALCQGTPTFHCLFNLDEKPEMIIKEFISGVQGAWVGNDSLVVYTSDQRLIVYGWMNSSWGMLRSVPESEHVINAVYSSDSSLLSWIVNRGARQVLKIATHK